MTLWVVERVAGEVKRDLGTGFTRFSPRRFHFLSIHETLNNIRNPGVAPHHTPEQKDLPVLF